MKIGFTIKKELLTKMRGISNYLLNIIEKEKVIYCPFCGEHSFEVNKETGSFECPSCKTKLSSEELDMVFSEDEYLDYSDKKFKELTYLLRRGFGFKYIVLNYGHHNLWDHSNTITRYKITNDGIVSVERFTAKGKMKWDESQETKRIKNMKQLYAWIEEIKSIIMTADSAEIQPCDAGGTIETLAFTDFTIKNASMWLANGEKCIFFLGMPELID